MKKFAVVAVVAVVLAGGAWAQDGPKPPTPQKEHEWLKQLDGEWETQAEMLLEPGKPPVKSKGTMSVRSLGGFWSSSEVKGDCMGTPFTGVLTIGYDARKKQYVGTWVCSMCDCLWKYEGTVTGQVLTLNTEGPNPADPSKTAKMRDVIEVKDKDHTTLTSQTLGEDGKWVTFMTMTSKRKK